MLLFSQKLYTHNSKHQYVPVNPINHTLNFELRKKIVNLQIGVIKETTPDYHNVINYGREG